jgi:serine/threonine protein kinase
MIAADEPDEQTVTRGGYVLPPQPHSGQFAGPADDPDRYELIGEGISGGEGTTWRARYHGRLQAPLPLAVKQLRPPVEADPDWPSAADRRRWQDQAALLRHLRLDHVVGVYEVFFGPPPHEAGKGQSEPALAAYLVMEWVEGPTLRELCRGRAASRATVEDRLKYVAQAATALTELSSNTRSAGNPSLHRDVKPSNCIVNDERGLVLIDVSTLRLVNDGFDAAGLHTPQYTAPEVLAAPHLPRTPAADAYSLGALAAFCLTGRDLAPGVDARAVLEQTARDAGVADPGSLAGHVVAMLDFDPARRPADLAEWGRRLTQLGRPATRRFVYAIAAAAGLLLLAGYVLLGPLDVGRREPGGAKSQPVSSPTQSVPAGYAGSIGTPADGSDVKQCSYFEGTAMIPDGMTLVLAMQNLTNGDPERYVEVVFGYEDPARLSNWRGAQYFGSGNQTVGQEYQVQLIAVPLEQARAWHDSPDAGSGNSLAQSGIVLSTVRLHRIEGFGPNGCEGP